MEDGSNPKDIEQKKRPLSPANSDSEDIKQKAPPSKIVKLEDSDLKDQEEEHPTDTKPSSIISFSSPPATTSEEDIVTATNAAVETLHGDRIVRLDTSAALFSEENWQRIQKMFNLMGDKSNTAKAFHEEYQNITSECLEASDKKLILETLDSNFKISFTLVNDAFSSKLGAQSLLDNETTLSVRDLRYVNEKRTIDLENTASLRDIGCRIELSTQLYHHAYEMIIIDADVEKCPADAEFHEKIHFLDDMLLPGALHCSTRGLIELAAEKNISNATQKEILKKLTSVTVPARLASSYATDIDLRSDGIKFGGTEVVAFALQNRALSKPLNLASLDSQEILALKSMIDSFQREVDKQESLGKLSKLCQSFSNELRVLSTSKDASENEALKGFLDELGDEEDRSKEVVARRLVDEGKERSG